MKKEIVIYDNYDLLGTYEEVAKANLKEQGNENPSDSTIWDEINWLDNIDWNTEKEFLEDFFNNGCTWILQGTNGRWNGVYRAGTIFSDFAKMLQQATKNCDYMKIYDKDGHFFIEATHHDGINFYEVKKITEKGEKYLQNWEEDYDDKRSEEYVHTQLMNRYSVLPRFAKTVYGC